MFALIDHSSSQNQFLQASHWLTEYLKTITLNRFTASAFKRVTVTSAEYVLIRVLVPSAFASSLTYLTTSTTGTVTKNMVHYYMGTNKFADHGSVLVPIPKKDLDSLTQNLAQQDSNWQWTFNDIPSTLLKKTKDNVINSCFGILDVTYQDISEGIGATVGSTLASGAFIAYMGPPSLFVLPMYFLAEGFSKSIGAFLGKHWGRRILGPNVLKPAIENAWQKLHEPSQEELEEDYARLIIELEQLNLTDKIELKSEDTPNDLLHSWYLMKEPEPKVKTLHWNNKEIIEDYMGSKSLSNSIELSI